MKKLLLKFIRKFYNEDMTYVEPLVKKWKKQFMQFFMSIFFNGLLFWLFLMAIIRVFPDVSKIIQLGPGFSHILSIFYLGMILWFISKNYIWYRKDWKKIGGKIYEKNYNDNSNR